MGIDPGIADTGFGLVQKDTCGHLECLAYGSIKTPKTDNLSARLLSLEQQLIKILKKYCPDLVVIEELFFNKNVKTALIVGQARGVVLLTLKKAGRKIVEMKPAEIKKAVAGYGAADKAQIQKMVKLTLKLKEIPRPDDAADALAMAISGSGSMLCRRN